MAVITKRSIFHFLLAPLTKSRRSSQRGTIFYVLTAHKDCRKLSILSFGRYILRRKKKESADNDALRSTTRDSRFFLSWIMQSKVTSSPPLQVVKANIASQYRDEDIVPQGTGFSRWFSCAYKNDRFPFFHGAHCNRGAIVVSRRVVVWPGS